MRERPRSSRQAWLLLCLVCCCLLAGAPAQAAGPPGPYDLLLAQLAMTRQTGRVRILEAGRSTQGRMIPLVALTPVRPRGLPRTRILIICCQHGDEPASAQAASDLIRRIAYGDSPESLLSTHARGAAGKGLSGLGDVLWLIVPVANPDGYNAGTRVNGAGVDLNRDWQSASQPETKAIRRVFETWKPQLVLDLHQWSPDDPPPASNGLEMVLRPHSPAQQRLERGMALSALRAVAAPGRAASLVTASPRANPSLAHRYFASKSTAAFLIETAAHDTPSERKELLTDMILVLSSLSAAVSPDVRAAALRHSLDFSYTRSFAAWLKGRRGEPDHGDSSRVLTTAVAALAFWALLSALGLRSREARPAWRKGTEIRGGKGEGLARRF